MNSLRHRFKVAAGFTIVELIIVIAVIGILASITIVSYQNTRSQADKSAYDATAQQVKMKMSEYYTDKNHYPKNKTDVTSYLTATGATDLKDTFSEAAYSYAAYQSATKTSCASDETTCQYYEITVDKSNWDGNDADTDILIKP